MPSSIAHRTLQPGTQFSLRETSPFFFLQLQTQTSRHRFFPKIGEQFCTLSLDSTEKSVHSAHSFRCLDNQKGTSAPSVAGIHPTRRSRPPTISSQISKENPVYFDKLCKKPEDQIPTSASPPCRRSSSDQGVLLAKLIPFQFLTACNKT